MYGSDYDKHKEEMARRSRVQTAAARDIGPIPPVADPERRAHGEACLEFFLSTYFPETFYLEWSEDQREAIRDIQRTIEEGGLQALAMPRGTGKTSIAVRAALWALLKGIRRFVNLLAAEGSLAEALVGVLKAELQTNELLYADYPEVCFPIWALANITKRAQGQTCQGRPTQIVLSVSEIVLPTVDGSKASGGRVAAFGLTASLRGQMVTTADGESLRPDLVIVDDPQTRESARSPTQVDYRLALMNGDVLGLAGPKRAIACMALVTVIYPRDLSDRILDREDNPAWRGRRYRLLHRLPTNLTLWDEYAEVRRNSQRVHGDNRDGNAFYLARRAEMDLGAVASWEARYDASEISAIQSAMNIRIDRPAAFASEYQNEPLPELLAAEVREIDPRALATRVSGYARRVVPPDTTHVTAFVDLGGRVHWFAVVAWNESFGGSVIDYGPWPRQGRSMFAATDARPSLATLYPRHTELQRVYAGLEALSPHILGQEYRTAHGGPLSPLQALHGIATQRGATLRVERCLIDAGHWAGAVRDFIARSPYGGVCMGSKGYARTTTSAGVGKWQARKGEKIGHHWRISLGLASGKGRQVQFDPDVWKTFTHDALTVPPGGPHGLTLFGDMRGGRPSVSHDLFADHCSAEYGSPLQLRGEVFTKWLLRPERVDNHLWDCLIGNAVAASTLGLKIRADGEAGDGPAKPKKATAGKRKMSEIQRAKMEKR